MTMAKSFVAAEGRRHRGVVIFFCTTQLLSHILYWTSVRGSFLDHRRERVVQFEVG
jgi:hypothetical protein